MKLLDQLAKKLKERARKGALRRVTPPLVNPATHIDFASNDYLGLARDPEFAEKISEAERVYRKSVKNFIYKVPLVGSSGSRLLTGNSTLYTDLESQIASFHEQKYALVANSGWDLNFALLSSLNQLSNSPIILYDEYCHNSMIMGIRMTNNHTSSISPHISSSFKFKHNNLEDLETLLQQLRTTTTNHNNNNNNKSNNNNIDRDILIVAESLYSMDGDYCPIKDILLLAERYDAMVLIDEAHAFAVCPPTLTMSSNTNPNSGWTQVQGIHQHPHLLGMVYTYGKAIGFHGATFVTNHEMIIPYLVNYASPIIYSTAMSIHTILGLQVIYEMLYQESHPTHLPSLSWSLTNRRQQLYRNIHYFQTRNISFTINYISSFLLHCIFQTKSASISLSNPRYFNCWESYCLSITTIFTVTGEDGLFSYPCSYCTYWERTITNDITCI
jgi:8-amino-7-oxononanoate synthase